MSGEINSKEKELLADLERDIVAVKKELNETVKAIVDGGYSKFPILLAHEESIAIAQKVIDKKDYQTSFNFSASTMEELVTRKIITEDKSSDFERRYKANKESFCILLVHSDSMRFIFTTK